MCVCMNTHALQMVAAESSILIPNKGNREQCEEPVHLSFILEVISRCGVRVILLCTGDADQLSQLRRICMYTRVYSVWIDKNHPPARAYTRRTLAI